MNFALDEEHLKSETARLQTFYNWPHSASQNPEVLAKNGFYYIGPSDRVRCVFCRGILKSWRSSDDVAAEHKKHFPRCPFVLNHNVDNIPLDSGSRGLQFSELLNQNFSGEISPVLKQPRYRQYVDRLKSLQDLPSYVVQDRELLATAGFFYTGHGDSVRCFACGGTLRSWEESDDPWIEHACWFPRCPYLLQEKGQQFVTDIQSNFVANIQNRQPVQSPQRESPQPVRRQRNNRHLLPYIQAVVDMGYASDLVLQVLQKEQKKGNNITTSEALLTAVEEHIAQAQNSNSPLLENKVTVSNPEDPGEMSDDRILCKICMNREVEVTFLPCGHLVCCEPCSRLVKECPVCRNTIKGTIRTYLA